MKLTPTFMSTLHIHFDRTLLWLQTFSTAINYTNCSLSLTLNGECKAEAENKREQETESQRAIETYRESSNATDQINISLGFTIDRNYCRRNQPTKGVIIMTDFGFQSFLQILSSSFSIP